MAEEQALNSSWGTDTGLVSNFEGDVVEAWFGPNERSTSDDPEIRNKVFLWWKFINITTEDDEVIDELTHRLSIGNGWEVADGGKRVVRSDGNENKKFNNSTALGRVIDRILGNGQEGAEHHEGMKDVLTVMSERNADTRHADIWTGLRFRMAETSYPIKDKDTGKMTTFSMVLPTHYLGPAKVGGGAAAATVAASPAPETSAPAETNGNGNGNGSVEVTLAKLRVLAKQAPDYQTFLDQALTVDDVATNQDLLNAVADDSDAGLFVTARA